MSSRGVGVWRRGQGSRGKGFSERDGGAHDGGNQGPRNWGNDNGARGGGKSRGFRGECDQREKIVWDSDLKSGQRTNVKKICETEQTGKLVGMCREFCPLEEKRMRTKERLLHR